MTTSENQHKAHTLIYYRRGATIDLWLIIREVPFSSPEPSIVEFYGVNQELFIHSLLYCSFTRLSVP